MNDYEESDEEEDVGNDDKDSDDKESKSISVEETVAVGIGGVSE